MKLTAKFGRAAAACTLFMTCASQANLQPGSSQPLVDEIFGYLKQQWPQVRTPILTETDVLEVVGGEPRLGRAALERLLAAPENGPNNTLVTFYGAHEAWHSVQAATLNDADIQRLRRARVLECEADFMAATVTSQRLRALGASEIDHFKAGSRLSDYIRTHSTGSANAQYYPAAEMRALTISLAWRYAVDSTVVRWAPSDTIPIRGRRDPASLMRDVCEMAANVHDGSIGNISMREMRQERTAGSEAPPASATSRTVQIENYGRQPVVLSYMLIARGFRSTGADDESHEVFDAVRDTVVVPAGERIERSYSLETYAPANGGDGFHYQTILTPYASPFATNTFISARYPASRPENDFCFERISGLDSSADRALLTRLATVALAAQENFRPVAASTFVDQAGNSRRYDLIGALQGDFGDNIRVYGSPWAPGPSAERHFAAPFAWR
jgi:hypothetical protein